jgi:hypothetical protein
VAGFAAVGPRVEQRLACGGEFVDRVELPRKMVEADRAAPLRAAIGADAEEAEVVMVPRAWQSEEGGIGAWFAGWMRGRRRSCRVSSVRA